MLVDLLHVLNVELLIEGRGSDWVVDEFWIHN